MALSLLDALIAVTAVCKTEEALGELLREHAASTIMVRSVEDKVRLRHCCIGRNGDLSLSYNFGEKHNMLKKMQVLRSANLRNSRSTHPIPTYAQRFLFVA